MTSKKETIETPEIEILNSSENPEIIKIKADEHSEADDILKNSPLGKLVENMEELKKIRGFFLASLLMGFTGLFVFHLWLGIAAIVTGLLDIQFGSLFTRKAAYAGIVMGLLGIILAL